MDTDQENNNWQNSLKKDLQTFQSHINDKIENINHSISSLKEHASSTPDIAYDRENDPHTHLSEKYSDFHEVYTNQNIKQAQKKNPEAMQALNQMAAYEGARYKAMDMAYNIVKKSLKSKQEPEKQHETDLRKASGSTGAVINEDRVSQSKFEPVSPNSLIDVNYVYPSREDRVKRRNEAKTFLKKFVDHQRNKKRQAERSMAKQMQTF